jgi:hypothetical protein
MRVTGESLLRIRTYVFLVVLAVIALAYFLSHR